MKILMTQWTQHTSTELASKLELIRKLFEETVCLPNTDRHRSSHKDGIYICRKPQGHNLHGLVSVGLMAAIQL